MEETGSFGDWLRRRRKALDLTQAELGTRVGVIAATVRRWEAEERRPSRQTAARLADALRLAPIEREAFVLIARNERAVAHLASFTASPTWTFPKQSAARLPISVTPLIGREQDVATLIRILQRPDVRLVTVTGTGGIGKTRLAMEAARILHDDGRDGCYFVDLALITDPALVAPAIARALGVSESAHMPLIAAMQAFLRAKRLLLILDNFEQVLLAAPLVADLLASAADLKILVTSRVALNIRG